MTRFSEAFFVINNSRKQALMYKESNYQDYAAISENMRNSDYFATLPKVLKLTRCMYLLQIIKPQ